MKLFYALLVTFLFLSCSGKENPKNTEMDLVKNLIGKKLYYLRSYLLFPLIQTIQLYASLNLIIKL